MLCFPEAVVLRFPVLSFSLRPLTTTPTIPTQHTASNTQHNKNTTHTHTQVSGIREVPATSAADMQRLLEQGALARTTGATRMNDASSRSHAIFTVMLQQRLLASPPAGAAPDQARACRGRGGMHLPA